MAFDNTRIFSLLAITGLLLVQGAQPSIATADEGGSRLEGTWELTVEGTPFRIVRTFLAGGVNIDSSNFTPITSTPGPLTVSDGHGNWKKTGPNQFAMTLMFLQVDPVTRRLDSVGKVREAIHLGADSNSYTGIFETEIFLPDGTKIIETGGKVVGTRISVRR